MAETPPTILVVEDEESFVEALVVGSVLYLLTRSQMAGYVALQTADQAAEVMALLRGEVDALLAPSAKGRG